MFYSNIEKMGNRVLKISHWSIFKIKLSFGIIFLISNNVIHLNI